MEKVTKERFLKELFSLNSAGNPETTFQYLHDQFLNKEVKTFDGTIITFDFIVNKYKSYLKYQEILNGDKDPKYLKSEDKVKDINIFLVKSMYNNSFIIPRKKRDFYLKGDHTIDYIKERIDKFKASLTQNKDNDINNIHKNISAYDTETD